MQQEKQQQPREWEFGGPLGALALTLLLPAVVVGLWAFCGADGCSVLPPAIASLDALWTRLAGLRPTPEAVAVVTTWLLLQVVLHFVVPGPLGHGLVQPDGSRDTYRLNGLATVLLVSAGVGASVYLGWVDLARAYDLFPQLLATTMALSVALSVYVYAVSFVPGTRLAHSGSTGNVPYDFWMGRALAPFLGPLDVKFFCEQRPGLMAWCVLNLAFALKQYQLYGTVTNSMVLVNLFHYIYVLDTFVFEPAVLSTMDITTEGFGFMLCFGDLVWVPFTYTLQARYLVDHPVVLAPWFAALLVALYVVGFAIFRLSNLEKDRFRRNPHSPALAYIKYLPTKRGTRLIINSWWGVARHINYLGDWLLFFASCLACGFGHILPYFYAVYFGALLFHREWRDDLSCEKKYGSDWETYRALVPWRIVPFVY